VDVFIGSFRPAERCGFLSEVAPGVFSLETIGGSAGRKNADPPVDLSYLSRRALNGASKSSAAEPVCEAAAPT